MPSDIRSFFGGKPAASKPAETKKEAPKKTRGRKVVDESDEEDEKPSPKKATPKKPAAKKREPSPVDEITTTSDYFGKSKPKRSAATNGADSKKTTPKATPKSTPVKTRTSTRAATKVVKLDHEEEGADDIFADQYKGRNGRSGGDDYEEGSSEEEEDVKPVRGRSAANKRGSAKKLKEEEDDFEPEKEDVAMKDDDPDLDDDDDDDFETSKSKPGKKSASAPSSRKRKSPVAAEIDDEGTTPKKRKPAPKTQKKKEDEKPESSAMQEIFDSIPQVRPPTPPAASANGKSTFKFGGGHANSGPAPAAGSKDVPTGAENCLAGLSFVFTGLLQSITREEGQSLVKRYGGKVMGAPSKNTSFVVLGSDAGPKKLQIIRQYSLKTIDEDGLFDLIRKMPANGGDSKAADKANEKKEKEIAKAREAAAEAEKADRMARAAAAKSANTTSGSKASQLQPDGPDNRLWTVKHAPQALNQICGNTTQVEKLQRWLQMFPKSQKMGFKLPGKDGSGVYRAVMIHGPPGIGKTTAAHLVAKVEGYDIVETNASDTRSKKLVENGLKGVLSTTSLMGYFAGDGKQAQASKKKLVLIMDEVDGMSAGDRGGVGALAAVCKKTQIPMILICNDRRQPKMKPFDFVTYDLGFRRPTVDQIRSRIMTIAFREKMRLESQVLNALIEGTGADIRQVVNMISTVKVDESAGGEKIDFDASKKMSKAWEKHVILKPWDILGKILGGGMFASSSKSTLNEKSELYFNDHEFSYLMLQENYLGTQPIRANEFSGKQRSLKHLQLVEEAANSISEGDLVDRLIHGSEQHWSLMPTHAIMSFVRPASFVSGSMAGSRTNFASWLGKNSSQGKFLRQVKEIQGHMRLRSSGDRHEIRQSYVPALWQRLINRLQVEGKDAVPDIIELMDSYFLTKEDFDSIMELGVGPMEKENVHLDTQAKSAFTRIYNQQSHPLPFIKASSIAAPKKTTKDRPDLEEAIEESDDGEVIEEPVAEEDDAEAALEKDKYIKKPKKKAASAKSKKSAAAADDDDDDGDEADEPKPKKGRGATKGKGKGKK